MVFVGLTIAITAGAFTDLDLQVALATHDAWQPSLHPLFQLIAELGGIELTTILMLALTVYLWRSGFGSDALVFVVFGRELRNAPRTSSSPGSCANTISTAERNADSASMPTIFDFILV